MRGFFLQRMTTTCDDDWLAHTGSGRGAVDDVTDPASVASARDVPRVLRVVADDDGAVLRAKHDGAVDGL